MRKKVLIVTSGEKMALYAANNISSAVRNFEDRSYARIFGIVLNHRNVENETEKVNAFAEKNNIPVVGEIPRSDEIIRWEDQGKTVIEGDENSEISEKFLHWPGSYWKVKKRRRRIYEKGSIFCNCRRTGLGRAGNDPSADDLREASDL